MANNTNKEVLQNKIAKLIEELPGKMMWKASLSIVAFSVNIGDIKEDFKNKRINGEFELFIECYWEIKKSKYDLIDSNMEDTPSLVRKIESLINHNVIASAKFSLKERSLSIIDETGLELNILPGDEEEDRDECWALFFWGSDLKEHWISVYRSKIAYED